MDKKYSIIVTHNEDGPLNIKRENTGFNIFEMIGLVESIKSDLITQSQSMVTENAKVERIVHDDKGDFSIDVDKDRVDVKRLNNECI